MISCVCVESWIFKLLQAAPCSQWLTTQNFLGLALTTPNPYYPIHCEDDEAVTYCVAVLSSKSAAMEPKNQVAVNASSTTAPSSNTHSSSAVKPSAATKVRTDGREPA